MQIIDLRNQRSGDKTACNRKASEARKALRNWIPVGNIQTNGERVRRNLALTEWNMRISLPLLASVKNLVNQG